MTNPYFDPNKLYVETWSIRAEALLERWEKFWKNADPIRPFSEKLNEFIESLETFTTLAEGRVQHFDEWDGICCKSTDGLVSGEWLWWYLIAEYESNLRRERDIRPDWEWVKLAIQKEFMTEVLFGDGNGGPIGIKHEVKEFKLKPNPEAQRIQGQQITWQAYDEIGRFPEPAEAFDWTPYIEKWKRDGHTAFASGFESGINSDVERTVFKAPPLNANSKWYRSSELEGAEAPVPPSCFAPRAETIVGFEEFVTSDYKRRGPIGIEHIRWHYERGESFCHCRVERSQTPTDPED